MIVYPYLLNNGFSLYTDIINPYPPVLTSLLSLFSQRFGYLASPYQILTWIIIFLIDISIFAITKKIFKKDNFALISTAFFAVFSIPFAVNGLWFDLVQTPLVLAAFYFFFKYMDNQNKKNLFFTFFLISIAFFIKQQVILLFFWFITLIIFKSGKKTVKIIGNSFLYIPLALLFLIFGTIFYFENSLNQFLYWTFAFPFFKASNMPGYIQLPNLKQIAVLISLFVIFIPSLKSKFKIIPQTAFILVLFAYPRFDYFHLIPSLSILSIAAGVNLKNLQDAKTYQKTLFVFAFIFLVFFTIRYHLNNWGEEVRFFDRESLTTASFLERITVLSSTIYVQNGPDQILPISNRLPPKPWVDEFSWYLETPGMQERIIESLKNSPPQFVVFKPYSQGTPYQLGSYRPTSLAEFLDSNYQNLIQISDNIWLKVKKKESSN